MGVDKSFLAGFGLLVNIDKTFPKAPKKQKPSCTHPEREGQKFCPVCGEKVKMITVDEYDAAYDFDFMEIVEENDILPKGYVMRLTDFYSGDEFFVGWGSHIWDEPEFFSPDQIPSFDEVREVVKGILLALRDIQIDRAGEDGERMTAIYPDVYALNEKSLGFHVIKCFS